MKTTTLGTPGFTAMPLSYPLRLGLLMSVAAIDCVPAVFRVAVKVCTPWSAAVKV